MMSMKRFLERAVKWLLTASGFVTSLVILLIIAFLFTEGAGLFREHVIEDGYVLVLNRENTVKELSAAEIKAIFDEDVTNWNELGGPDMAIGTFRLEDADDYFTEEQLGPQYENAGSLIAALVESRPGMIAFIPESMLPEDPNLNFIKDKTISPGEVLAGSEWFPTATPAPLFGIWPLLSGTLWVSLFAILFALPFGISIAVYMAEVASGRVRNILKPIIELLNGIPSVVYGFFGLVVIVPMMRDLFGGNGKSVLTASILLGIMILPTLISVGESSIRAVPESYYEGALALGATPEEAMFKVMLPAAKSGVTAGIILAIDRSIGEAMAVSMVAGNQPVIPESLLSGVRTLTSNIVLEMGYATDMHRAALLATGVVLFVFILLINLTFSLLRKKEDK